MFEISGSEIYLTPCPAGAGEHTLQRQETIGSEGFPSIVACAQKSPSFPTIPSDIQIQTTGT